MTWRIRGAEVPLGRPVILGIVNVTPDSFSDGGNFFSPTAAVRHAETLIADGADLIDVGGESTRPQGAVRVPADEEGRRIIPVIEGLRQRCPHVPISVDTAKADVAADALDAGAAVINDVSSLRGDPALADVCASRGAGLILMHSRGSVSDMATYRHAVYGPDAMGEVIGELATQIAVARAAGVDARSIVVDPGIGFAKRARHSLTMLSELPRLARLGFPILIGVSRKRFIGEITGVTVAAERVYGTVGANVAALARGARLFRVHDVRANRHALDVAWAILEGTASAGGDGGAADAIDERDQDERDQDERDQDERDQDERDQDERDR